jgi:hypothetical protein
VTRKKDIEVPDVTMRVHRNDGTSEFDVGTDAYSILIEEVRVGMASLGKLDDGRLHARDVLAGLSTIKDKKARGLELTTTVTVPLDPELAGAMLFHLVVSVRQKNPAAYAVLIRRLGDAGLLSFLP